MTVSSQTNNATFVGNGVTTVFPLPFRFFSNGDVFAYFIDSTTGASTPMSLGVDYTLTGAGEPEVNGNAVSVLTTTVPLASMRGLYVERVMQQVQETDIVNQGQFFASTHEDVFDRLTMLIQQAKANSAGAIRVAIGDPEPTRLVPATQRANLLMGFDSQGNPIAVAPVSGSASDLAMNLANDTDPAKGAEMIGYKGRTLAAYLSRVIDPKDHPFNATGDGVTDDREAIENALDFIGAQGGGILRFSKGRYLLNSYSHNTDLANTHGNILPLYSNLTIEFDPGAQLIVGPFFDDKPFHALSAFNAVWPADFQRVSNVHIRGGVFDFSGESSRYRTGYFRRIGVEFGNSYNTSVVGTTFKNGDISNCINAGWAANGDLHLVRDCNFVDLVQESPANTDHTTLYCNATRSTVADCHFHNSARRAHEISCVVELHKSDSRWVGGSFYGYTRGTFLVAIASETTLTTRLEVSGVKGVVTNQFIAPWVDPGCTLIDCQIYGNDIVGTYRDASMTNTMYYGVSCFLGTSGTAELLSGTLTGIKCHGNKFKAGLGVPYALSAVLLLAHSIQGLHLTGNQFSVARFMHANPGVTITNLYVKDNHYEADRIQAGSIFADFTCQEVIASHFEMSLGQPVVLANVVNFNTVKTGWGNFVNIHPENTYNTPQTFAASAAFLGGLPRLEYPADMGVITPQMQGAVPITTTSTIGDSFRATVIGRGSLPTNYVGLAALSWRADGHLSGLAWCDSAAAGTYSVRALISNMA